VYRRTSQSGGNKDALPRSRLIDLQSFCQTNVARIACRAIAAIPLRQTFDRSELLPKPLADSDQGPGHAATAATRIAVMEGSLQAKSWGMFVCSSKREAGTGFMPHELTLVREWARLILPLLVSADLVRPSIQQDVETERSP
jgi:hypothetical protein